MRRYTNGLIALLCIASSLAVSAQAHAQSNSLAWKLEKGQKFEVFTDQTIKTVMLIGDQTVETKVVSQAWADWDVVGESDGIADIESTIRRMKIDTDAMGNKSIVDTEGEIAEGPGSVEAMEMVLPMIDETITMKVSERGKMEEIKMPEAIGDAVDSMLGAQTQQMLKASMENSLLEFPETALEVGKGWDKTINTPSPIGEMKIVTSYIYQGETTKDGLTLHQFDVDIKMDFGDSKMIAIDSQDTTGAIYFDENAGRIHSSEVNQKVEMTVEAGGQSIKQTLNQTATGTFTLKK